MKNVLLMILVATFIMSVHKKDQRKVMLKWESLSKISQNMNMVIEGVQSIMSDEEKMMD